MRYRVDIERRVEGYAFIEAANRAVAEQWARDESTLSDMEVTEDDGGHRG